MFPQFVFWLAVVAGITTFLGLGGIWWVVSNELKAKTAQFMLLKRKSGQSPSPPPSKAHNY